MSEPWYIRHFSPLDPRLAADFWPTMNDLRDRCPVAHSDQHGGLWTFSRYDDIRMIGLDWETFSSADSVAPIAFESDQFKMLPIECDPPRHRVLRRLLDPYFSRGAVQDKADAIRAVAVGLTDKFVASGACEFMADFALPFPALSFFQVMMDLPEHLIYEVTPWVDLLVLDPGRAAEALENMARWCNDVFAFRRGGERRDDVLDAILFRPVQGDHELVEVERVQMLINLIVGAMETTAMGLGNMVVHLARDESLRRRCRELTDLGPAVDEFIRYEAPAPAFGRTVTRDFEFDGVAIPAGARIVANLGSANRDPAEFSNPDDLQIGRAEARRNLSFGVGPHLCLGRHLAKLEMHIALEEILERMPEVRLADDEPIPYRNALSRGPSSLPLLFATHPEGSRAQ